MTEEHASYVRWDPPDTVFVAIIGDISPAESDRLTGEIRRLTLDKPRAFLLSDVRRVGEVGTETRNRWIDAMKSVDICGTAIFGASFYIRVIATLGHKIGKVLHGRDNNPYFFCDTEAQARAWIEERRATTPI